MVQVAMGQVELIMVDAGELIRCNHALLSLQRRDHVLAGLFYVAKIVGRP